MNVINNKRNKKFLVFLTICVLLSSSLIFQALHLKEKQKEDQYFFEKITDPDMVCDQILQKITMTCSKDFDTMDYKYFYKDIDKNYGFFPSETLIYMADGSYKKIKDVSVDDKIFSYDLKNNDFVISNVVSKNSEECKGIFSINDDILLATDANPFVVKKSDGEIVWASFNPIKSNSLHENRDSVLIEIGDKLFSYGKGWVEIEKIDYIKGDFRVYSLGVDSDFHNFFADSFLVSNAGSNFYVLKGFKEGIDLFYKYGYTVFNLSKIKNLTSMGYDELREKFGISVKYNFRIIINVQGVTYSSDVESTIYESDVSAVVSKNILIRDGSNFYYGWLRIEVFVN